jgi:hypothetical protein
MAAGATYEPIARQTLGSAAASVTFSSIPQGYTDLILVADILPTETTRVKIQVGNGSVDTTSNYSWTVLYGTGSLITSNRVSSYPEIDYYWSGLPVGWSNYIIQLQNYSNTTINKTIIGKGISVATEVLINIGLWRSTSAINTIKIFSSAGNFEPGSTVSLYGIAAA